MKISYCILFVLLSIALTCDDGFININNHCFYSDDIEVLQDFIDNSIDSNYGLDCDPYDIYCGSPNPYMDQTDSWFWKIIDGEQYYFANGNGIVEPLELGIQEWENGRLKSIMCGAYIYCQLSGNIPNSINQLSSIEQLRLEYNYLSGLVPDLICDLNLNDNDYLEFDLTGNHLCPPYPSCIEDAIDYQDPQDCTALGDINFDGFINVADIIIGIELILIDDYNIHFDMNNDSIINVIDVIMVVNMILEQQDIQLPEECYLEPDPGYCFAAIPMYFYNENTGNCEEFTWGGCGGIVPFESLNECVNTCE